MEVELKYRIPTEKIADEIWLDDMFSGIEEKGSREIISFYARYFDTDGFDLAANQIAYRVRKEGENTIAVVKWMGRNEGAVHMREELSVPVISEKPDISVFQESDIGKEMTEIVGDKELISIVDTVFVRKRFRVDTGTGLFEISIDKGNIVNKCGTIPILEIEVELFSGEQDELICIGERIKGKYGLEIEEKSKYVRGKELISDTMSK